MKKKILYIDMDGVLVDFESGIDQLDEKTKKEYEDRFDEVPGIFALMEPMPGAIDAFIRLSKVYDTYILTTSPWDNPTALQDKQNWVKEKLREHGRKRLITSHHKNLNKGDYIIDDRNKRGVKDFEGEHIWFGKDGFYHWYDVLDYLLPDWWGENDHIVKHLMKKEKLTAEKAKEKAHIIVQNYREIHKERDEARNLKLNNSFKKALDWEFFNLEADYNAGEYDD